MRDFNDNSEVRQDKHIVIRLLSYLKPYTWKFIGSFLLMIVTTFANMVLPLASGLAVDLMAKPEAVMPLEIKMLILGIGAAVLLIIMMASVVIGFYQNMMLQHIGQQVTHDMRIEVFK
ncbi:MAG TPA: ABC transporter ATP-binding protein, partial [Acholeplasma sp.]|nr:ABC transporter ATP-binding protein [Acholeplasma sp.]